MEQTEIKDKLLDDLNYLLDTFTYSMKKISHKINCDLPLAGGQVFLLYLLSEHDNYKVSELANRLGLTAGAVTSMTDKLIQFGLIKRERSEVDRRVVWISLTEKGRQVIGKIQQERFNILRSRFGALTEADLNRTIEVLRMLQKHLGN